LGCRRLQALCTGAEPIVRREDFVGDLIAADDASALVGEDHTHRDPVEKLGAGVALGRHELELAT
jgi:hypothetical protein